MDESRATLASNLIRLRTAAGMTQAELGEKLNYSDKSVSKWERGDGAPDVFVLRQIAQIYGVTLDYLLEPHTEIEPKIYRRPDEPNYSTTAITWVSVLGIWTLALMIFVVFWIAGFVFWQFFVYCVPVTLIVLLVLNSLWKRGKMNLYIVMGLVLSLIVAVYLTFLSQNLWQLFLIAIPAELVVYASFRIPKNKKKPPQNG